MLLVESRLACVEGLEHSTQVVKRRQEWQYGSSLLDKSQFESVKVWLCRRLRSFKKGVRRGGKSKEACVSAACVRVCL